MKNLILKIVGGLSLGLGIIGAFLPLMPTTCFILLAAWAFGKSSPAFHSWLCNRSPFSESIQNWNRDKSIPLKAKIIATSSLLISFTLTAVMIPNPILLTALGIGMSVLIVYLVTRPTSKNDRNSIATSKLKYRESPQQAF